MNSIVYQYKDQVNENLLCSICHYPFQDPITISCQHTFCLACLQQHLKNHSVCPLDKTRIDLNWTQSKIVLLMVDELIVYCANRKSGCEWAGQRQFLKQHLEQCQFQLLDCQWGCGWRGLESDDHECVNARVVCTECEKEVLKVEYGTHKNECFPEKVDCVLCGVVVLISKLELHTLECPQANVCCDQSRYGCSWNGKRIFLEKHQAECIFEKLKGFFSVYQMNQDKLTQENQALKTRIADLENTLYDMNLKLMELLDRFAVDDGANPLFAPVILDNFAHDIRLLRTDMDQLNMSIAQKELRDQQNLSEQSRMRDEIQTLRTSHQTLQVQLFNLAIRSQATTSGSSQPRPATSAKKGDTKL